VVAGFDASNLYFLIRTEPIFNQFARADVSHLGLIKGPEVPRGAVYIFFNTHELPIKTENIACLDVRCLCHILLPKRLNDAAKIYFFQVVSKCLGKKPGMERGAHGYGL